MDHRGTEGCGSNLGFEFNLLKTADTTYNIPNIFYYKV